MQTVDAGVITTSHYLPELQTYDVSTNMLFGPADTRHGVAVIRADAQNGTLYISERN